MPGIILFKRRWSLGSDDVFIPATLFLVLHIVGCVYLVGLVSKLTYDSNEECSQFMFKYIISYLVLLIIVLLTEFLALVMSCRSTFLKPSRFLKPIIYIRLILFLMEFNFIIIGVIYLIKCENKCQIKWYDKLMQKTVLAIVICTSLLMLSILSIIPCVYDKAGKSFYKLKRYESNYKRQMSLNNHMANTTRHLKHQKMLKLYNENWKFRFKLFYCCLREKKAKSAFTGISEMLACFFYKYDVVPSDLLAGLLLIREKQKQNIQETLLQQRNDIYDYLSGIPITSETKFFNLTNSENLSLYQDLIYFFDYAAASYGWPMYLMNSKDRFACLKLLPSLKNCSFCNQSLSLDSLENINNDNCCFCYYDALVKQLPSKDTDVLDMLNESGGNDGDEQVKDHIKLVHANFSSDVGKPSFFVAIDYFKKKIVVTIRGTESLKDSLTTMQWNAAPIPYINPNYQWYAHQGYINAACYLKDELESKNILNIAFNFDLSKNTDKYDLLIVGHSYGAGVGSILSILLKANYPNLKCYSYSPLGGILSKSCMKETKEFITTVILGKDMVPRLGITQLEKLQAEVVEALKTTNKPKWKILSSLCCCKCTTECETKEPKTKKASLSNEHASSTSNSFQFSGVSCHNNEIIIDKNTKFCIKPSNNSSYKTNNAPRLYPPGRILHVVRKYPRGDINDSVDSRDERLYRASNSQKHFYSFRGSERANYRTNSNANNNMPVYQVIETDNENFNELLISPRMLQDHMPDNLIKCMKAVLEEPAPKKPPRQFKNTEEIRFNEYQTLDSIPFIEPETNSPLLKQYKIKYPNTPIPRHHHHQSTREFQKNASEENLISSAPLAKPESFSDLINEFDDLTTNIDEQLMNTSNMYYDDSMMSYKLDSNAYNTNIPLTTREDDLLKSNLAWWPYYESTSTTHNTSLNKTGNKSLKSPNETKKLNNSKTKNKINIIIENMSGDENDLENDDLITNRMSTSTPRTDSIQECLHTSSSTSHTTAGKQKQRSSHFLTSCYQYNEYKRFDLNSKFEYDEDYDEQFLSLNAPKYARGRLHSSSHDDRMHLFSSSYSNSSALSNLFLMTSKASKSLAPTDAPFKDQSSLLSFSFSNNIKFADDYSAIKVLSSKISNENNTTNQHNESLNYKSIEKLPILKPQSKDYILCFDTSSIDNSSSLVSNDGMNSLINSPTQERFKLMSDSFTSSSNEGSYYMFNGSNGKNLLKTNETNNNSSSSGSSSKKLNSNSNAKLMISNDANNNVNTNENTFKSVLDSCDSGVDTARTLSPYVFNNLVLSKNTTEQELNELN